MFRSLNIRHVSQKRSIIRIAMAVFIMALVSVSWFMTDGIAEAKNAGSEISCGYDSICNTISGNEFDLILYSSLGSEMVILYDRNKVDTVVANTSEKYYSKSTGNVRDAIYYLSLHANYAGFKFKQARKSTGLFRTKVIEGVYVAVPEYTKESDNKPPEYRFTEKDGKLTIRIRPVIRPMSN